MFLLVPVTMIFLHEKRIKIDSAQLFANAGQQLRNIVARKRCGPPRTTALFYIAPGFGTAIFYKQQNELHMSTEVQGYLQLVASVTGVIASVGYGYFCRRFNLRTLLFVCLLTTTITNLGYMFYSSFNRAQFIDGLNGFGFNLANSR